MMTANAPSTTTTTPRYSGAELSEPVGGSSAMGATPGSVGGGATVGGSVGGATVGGAVGVVGATQPGTIVMLWPCVAVKAGPVESTTITAKS